MIINYYILTIQILSQTIGYERRTNKIFLPITLLIKQFRLAIAVLVSFALYILLISDGDIKVYAQIDDNDKLSNNYISSMQFCIDNSLFLTPNINNSFALRRNIRIKSSKLPPDFFYKPAAYRYANSPGLERPIADISNRSIATPSFQCNKRQKSKQGGYRKVETARPSLEKTQNSDELISGVLSTSKKLRKVFRKQSIDFKDSYSVDMMEKHFRLPKILNKEFIKNY